MTTFRLITISILAIVICPAVVFSEGNKKIYSYADAKRFLYGNIYFDHRVTVYCAANFDENRYITLPEGFMIATHEDRAYRAETEHIVAAENFGRAFVEWREGSPQCVDNRGFPFKGRKCAETNPEFQLMEADLHNLAPAIGAVNAARRNFRLALLTSSDFDWGSCPIKISGRSVEPPDRGKGIVARSHLYMASAYTTRFRLSKGQQKLFEAWNKQFPPDKWESEREKESPVSKKTGMKLPLRNVYLSVMVRTESND